MTIKQHTESASLSEAQKLPASENNHLSFELCIANLVFYFLGSTTLNDNLFKNLLI